VGVVVRRVPVQPSRRARAGEDAPSSGGHLLAGENGSGKSTLLEAAAIALGLNAEGGGRNIRFVTRPSHSVLHGYLDLGLEGRRPPDGFFLRAESFFNLATEVERLDRAKAFGGALAKAYGDRPLHEMSHGEAFSALFENRMSRPASTCWTSLKPPSRPRGSSRCWGSSTGWWRAGRSW
jgi:hypothetical protein